MHLQSLTDGINTKTPAGRFFFHVMASLAQMERELLVECTRAGLTAAKKLGRVGGRKRRMTESKIQSGKTLLISGVSPKEVARNLGLSIPTLYRWLPCIRTLLASRFFSAFVKLAHLIELKGLARGRFNPKDSPLASHPG